MNSKSIIIFSENQDYSTNYVMKWCKAKGYQVNRINSDDRQLKVFISERSVQVATSFDRFEIDKNSLCWFRRAEMPSVYVKYQHKDPLQNEIEIFNFTERKQAFSSLKSWVTQNCKYSSYIAADKFTKVDVLLKAAELDIQVPDWITTSEKEYAVEFAKNYDFVACKPFEGFIFSDKDGAQKTLTEKLNFSDISAFHPTFIPRFFQQYIEKKYELRNFYFHGRHFTYAILSQSNEKTAVDFRNYDNDRPNRCIPFVLPDEYSKKLTLLMQKLELDTGSCDILVDKDDNYYFLEVNPVGQFGQGSHLCNQNIEEYIANHLMNMSL